MASIFSK